MAPLGPLTMISVLTGAGAWTLTVTVAGRAHTIQAEQDPVSGGLVLATPVEDGSAELTAGWVTDTKVDEGSGKIIRQLWLHGDGLTPALLLNAAAALAAVAVVDEPVVELPTVVIPAPPSEPEPIPLERPRSVSWNSFEFGGSDREEPSPEPTVVESTEANAAQPAEPEALPAETAVAVTAPADVIGGMDPSASTGEAPASAEPRAEAEFLAETFLPTGKSGNCRECGSPFTPEHAFCTNCGARLN